MTVRIDQGAAPVPTPEQIEQEVFQNVQRQPLAEGTVEDLALPDDFLRRVADRIVRASFEERYRIVVEEDAQPAPQGSRSSGATPVALSIGALLLAGIVWVLVARREGRGVG